MQRNKLVWAILGMVFTSMLFASSALADNPGNGFQVSTAKATSTVKFSVDFNFIGTYVMHTTGLKKKNGKVVGCFNASGTWTNSVRTPVIKPYQETSSARFCPLKKPVTVNGVRYTHVKVAGGKTGNPCWNLAIPPGKPQPKPQIKGPVLDVRSMANIEIPVKVNASANASVWGTMQCPGGAVGASASGTGSINGTIKVKISQSLLMSNRGQVNGPVRADIEQQIRASVEGKATADATANITVTCGPGTPPPTYTCPSGTTGTWPNCVVPPPTYTCPSGTTGTWPNCVVPPPPPAANRQPTVRLECPAHVYSNADPNKTGKAVIRAYVSDPDGDRVSVGFERPQYGSYTGGAYPLASDTGGWGIEYKAPVWTSSTDLIETIRVVVDDGRGLSTSKATATCSFPIKKDEF